MISKIVLSGTLLCFFTAVILMFADIANDYTLHLRALSGGFFCGMLVFMFLGALNVIWE